MLHIGLSSFLFFALLCHCTICFTFWFDVLVIILTPIWKKAVIFSFQNTTAFFLLFLFTKFLLRIFFLKIITNALFSFFIHRISVISPPNDTFTKNSDKVSNKSPPLSILHTESGRFSWFGSSGYSQSASLLAHNQITAIAVCQAEYKLRLTQASPTPPLSTLCAWSGGLPWFG